MRRREFIAGFGSTAAWPVVARAQRHKFAGDARLLIVEDVLEGLRDLSRAARARTRAPRTPCARTANRARREPRTATNRAIRTVVDTPRLNVLKWHPRPRK